MKLFDELSVPAKILLIENGNGYPIFPAYGLINKGYEVIQACHGYEALSLALRHPDISAAVIVESNLRFMTAKEIAQRLRQIRPTAEIVTLYPDRRWPFLPESLPWLHRAAPRERSRTRSVHSPRMSERQPHNESNMYASSMRLPNCRLDAA